ncbi:hypothetical protein [Blackfly microvirus SF02]|uniref:Uncharacterized protein n=1 Tax=Blackfly microvirus SF02 TaxID=2576452 RepID=A0A4P8PST5_9VIRU|nr:hypothetical protein [Blackfly microvirus SF02]
MKFKSIATPAPSPGQTIPGKYLVQPNQTMSLSEILERFTRGEPLSIGKPEPTYHESEDDLEKISHMDPVDKQEFIDRQKETQKRFDKEEKQRKKREEDRLVKLAAEKLAADKLAEKGSQPDPAK